MTRPRRARDEPPLRDGESAAERARPREDAHARAVGHVEHGDLAARRRADAGVTLAERDRAAEVAGARECRPEHAGRRVEEVRAAPPRLADEEERPVRRDRGAEPAARAGQGARDRPVVRPVEAVEDVDAPRVARAAVLGRRADRHLRADDRHGLAEARPRRRAPERTGGELRPRERGAPAASDRKKEESRAGLPHGRHGRRPVTFTDCDNARHGLTGGYGGGVRHACRKLLP